MVRVAGLVAVAILVAGCAHPIGIGPDLTALAESSTQYAKNAGYYIAPEDRDREVTTAGGGGDKISYRPYRDMEAGIYKVLSSNFANVTRLEKPNDATVLREKKIDIVFLPTIATTSSSSSLVTWPPTAFSVQLESRLFDAAGHAVGTNRVTGFGYASFDEFKSDYGLAGKRAALDALDKLSKALSADSALRSRLTAP